MDGVPPLETGEAVNPHEQGIDDTAIGSPTVVVTSPFPAAQVASTSSQASSAPDASSSSRLVGTAAASRQALDLPRASLDLVRAGGSKSSSVTSMLHEQVAAAQVRASMDGRTARTGSARTSSGGGGGGLGGKNTPNSEAGSSVPSPTGNDAVRLSQDQSRVACLWSLSRHVSLYVYFLPLFSLRGARWGDVVANVHFSYVSCPYWKAANCCVHVFP